jgi:hypothetical protein
MSLATNLAQIPNITVNRIPRATATGFANSAIFDNGTNVGIGNTNTTFTFDVTGTGRFTGALTGGSTATFSGQVEGTIINSTSNAFRLNGNNALSLVTLNSQSVVKINAAGFWGTQLVGANDQGILINNTGQVGIGTTTPYVRFDVLASSGGTDVAYFKTSDFVPGNTGSRFGIGFTGASGNVASLLTATSNGQNEWNDMQFKALNHLFFTNNGERMRITSGGNVGINVTGPTGRFHIYSNNTPSISGTSPTGAFVIQSDATTAMTMGVHPSSPFYGWIQMRHGAVADLVYGLAIQPLGGTVQIGGTLGIGGRVQVFNDSGTGINIMNSANSGGLMSFLNTTAVQIGTITTNNSSTSYNTTSDYRLKEDLKEINGLQKLSAIKVYDFKWKNSSERMDGVIAHELAEIIPYAVYGEKDAVNIDGKINPQGVDYSKIVPVLVKAIQEQQEEINSLKSQLGGK